MGEKGGELATVSTAAIDSLISTLLASFPYWRRRDLWLGGSDRNNEGEWRWTTGELFYGSGNQVQYSNWADGEPNDEFGEDCLEKYNWSGKWNDIPCRHENGAAYLFPPTYKDNDGYVCSQILSTTSSPSTSPTNTLLPTVVLSASPTEEPTSKPSRIPTISTTHK